MTSNGGSSVERAKLVARAGHNIDLIPAAFVRRDYQTDSLMSLNIPSMECEAVAGDVDALLVESLVEIFDMPYVLPVSQGRLAECILSSALVSRAGQVVLGSACFPTTKAHLGVNGAQVVITPTQSPSTGSGAAHYRGDIDVEALREQIENYGPDNVSHLFLEPCTNATGGHPISLDNIRRVRELADYFGLPFYLDSTRIISNAFLIKKTSVEFGRYSVKELVAKMCGYADGMTMSVTKEFPVSIGGLVATRNKEVFAQCIDKVALLGTGLDLGGKKRLLAAVRDFSNAASLVQARVERVQFFHHLISSKFKHVDFPGAHAAFLSGRMLREAVPSVRLAERAYLNHLFIKHGIRGMLNPCSLTESDGCIMRFAIPIIGKESYEIEADAEAIVETMMEDAVQLVGLEEVSRPGGLSGKYMATYKQVEAEVVLDPSC